MASVQPDIYVDSGSPSFRGLYDQHTHANYNLYKSLHEIIDNVITKCDKIHVHIITRGNNIYSIKVSDNWVQGFQHLNETGSKNPLNLAHIRDGHADDNETSQFGIGLKASSMSTANKMTIITRTDKDGCIKVLSDYKEMYEQDTFKSKRFTYDPKEYMDVHGFEYGTSILLEDIKSNLTTSIDKKNKKPYEQIIIDLIINSLSDTYNGFIKNGIELRVNGILVEHKEPLYFMKECTPFTQIANVFQYEEDGDTKYYMEHKTNGTYAIYNNDTRDLLTELQTKKEMKNIKEKEVTQIADIKSTFIYWWYKKTHKPDAENAPKDDMPKGKIDIIKRNRKLGTWNLKKTSRNGSRNYTQSEITIDSKKIAEEIGLNYNKTISDENENNLINALRKFVDHLTCGFNADTSQPAYTKLEEIAKTHNIIADPVDEMTANPASKKVVRKKNKKAVVPVEHNEEPVVKLGLEHFNTPISEVVTEVAPNKLLDEPVSECNLEIITHSICETNSEVCIDQHDVINKELPKINVVSEPAVTNVPEPVKRVSAHVVKQHAKGSVSSDDFDSFIQYMIKNKEQFMHDPRTRTAYNAFMF
jgi:hypothetical protein